jgi:hypothetical protein
MKIPKLTTERANHLLSYNPSSGNFTWKVSQGKVKEGADVGTIQHGYKKATIDKEQIKLHRLAWFITYGVWPSGQIDHIDGDKLNNKISNLRDVSMSVNMQNRYAIRRKENDLPYGVTRNPKGKFLANIRIGTYDTVEEAAEAFMRAKRLIHEGCTR